MKTDTGGEAVVAATNTDGPRQQFRKHKPGDKDKNAEKKKTIFLLLGRF